MRNPVALVSMWQTGNYWGSQLIGLTPPLVEPGVISMVAVSAFGVAGRFRLVALLLDGEKQPGVASNWFDVTHGWVTTDQLAVEVPALARVQALVEVEKGSVVPQILVAAYL